MMARHPWSTALTFGCAATAVHGSLLFQPQVPLIQLPAPVPASAASTLPLDSQAHIHEFPIHWQDERTCNTSSPQFTGRVPISPGKDLFFWFVESQTDARDKPTILWLSGGPGASSLVGLFEEIGPCEFSSANETVENPFSWSNFANLLFLDQPASVGFSTVNQTHSPPPTTLAEASPDVTAFLTRFAAQHPHYLANGLYLAAESFGGRYAPRFAADMVRAQPSPALPFTIIGLILVDALVDAVFSPLGHYEFFCTPAWQTLVQLNDSACATIAARMPEAERLRRLCELTMDPYVCGAAREFAQDGIYSFFQEQEVDTRRRSPYDLRLGCERPPICIPSSQFSVEPYLNRPEIQRLLGVGEDVVFKSINFELNAQWSANPELMLPTTRDLTYLLDEGGVKVLVINGNYDVTITTTGAYREYDELPWSSNIQFRLDEKRDWFYTAAADGQARKGGQRKGRGLLQLADVDDAGHMAPGDQKEAVASLVRGWMEL